jgi:KDO2-lipid IV(A) lauroyltransferase
MATIADAIEYGAARAAVAILGLMSWDRAVSVGAQIAAFGYRPLGIRRRVVETQIATAFPEWTHERVLQVARASYENLGRTSAEAALLPTLTPERVISMFDGQGDWDVLARAHAAGKGVIVVTGHIGNWELAGSYIAARGIPIEGVTRRMTNPIFDRYLTSTREKAGLAVIADSDAVRRIPRALRAGHVVAMVADQGTKGMASTFVPFFGRLAKTPRGPGVFALRAGVPVLAGTAVRLPGGTYRALVEPVEVVATGDRERDVDAVVARYTAVLERWVRAYPEQYLWHHRRWRRSPPAPGEQTSGPPEPPDAGEDS